MGDEWKKPGFSLLEWNFIDKQGEEAEMIQW